MLLPAGALYAATYLQWHEDQNPLIFVLYSDGSKTHAINVHYILRANYDKLAKMFVQIQSKRRLNTMFFNDPRKFYYNQLKPHFKEFIDVAYRTYHTSMLTAIPAHPILHAEIGKLWPPPRPMHSPEMEKLRQTSLTDNSVKKLKHLMLANTKGSATLQSVKSYVHRLKQDYIKDTYNRFR